VSSSFLYSARNLRNFVSILVGLGQDLYARQCRLLLTHKKNNSPNPEPNKAPKERKRNSNDPLTKHEVEQLLSKVDNLKDYTLLLFGFTSGVRVGELSFDYNSINWQEAYVSIWDEKKDRHRKVYVPDSVLNSLRRYWNERADRKSPKFFDISAKTVERIIQRWTALILNKPKSWHCVRHTYITLSFENNIPISIVIENTGDKPVTILQYYTKLSPAFIKRLITNSCLPLSKERYTIGKML
jgi:integrase